MTWYIGKKVPFLRHINQFHETCNTSSHQFHLACNSIQNRGHELSFWFPRNPFAFVCNIVSLLFWSIVGRYVGHLNADFFYSFFRVLQLKVTRYVISRRLYLYSSLWRINIFGEWKGMANIFTIVRVFRYVYKL
jgi:hypothetical protein